MAKNKNNGGNLGFEAKLWIAADKLRNSMDAADHKFCSELTPLFSANYLHQ